MSRDFERLRQKLDELKDCMVESSLAKLRCCDDADFTVDEHKQDVFSPFESIIWCKRTCDCHGSQRDRITLTKSAKGKMIVFRATSKRGFE